jgi:hypothetical protein
MSEDSTSPQASDMPELIRFKEVRVEPWPDGLRVRVHVLLTPFNSHPNLEAAVFGEDDFELQRINIVETTDQRFVFTMHLRGAQIPGKFRLSIQIYLDPENILDQKTIYFEINGTT